MLMKPLISAVLLSVALTSNGTGPLAANGRQDLRPVPQVPSTADSTSAVSEPGERVKRCARSFIKPIHYRQPVA